MRSESLSRRQPWIAAAIVAVATAVVCGVIAALTGRRDPVGDVAVPVAVAAWLLLGLSYRLWSRAPF